VRLVYLVSVWVHILAATIWIGGLFFVVLVVVPWLRRGNATSAQDAGRFLSETGERFRAVGWICFGLVAATGVFNLGVRGVRLQDVVDPAWWTSGFGSAVGLKLLAFGLVLVVSFVHDFRVGPAATDAIRGEPDSARARSLRRRASLLGRLNGVLALVLVALGVVIVRGWPW
jgi:uncharacterized membrane protein